VDVAGVGGGEEGGADEGGWDGCGEEAALNMVGEGCGAWWAHDLVVEGEFKCPVQRDIIGVL